MDARKARALSDKWKKILDKRRQRAEFREIMEAVRDCAREGYFEMEVWKDELIFEENITTLKVKGYEIEDKGGYGYIIKW